MFGWALLYLNREGRATEVQCYDSLKERRDGNGDAAGDPAAARLWRRGGCLNLVGLPSPLVSPLLT